MSQIKNLHGEAALWARLPKKQGTNWHDAVEALAQALTEKVGETSKPGRVPGIPADMIEESYRQGYAAYQAGNYEQARKAFNLACRARVNAQACMGLASALQQLHDYPAALEAYQLAQLGLPDDAGVMFRMAECQIELGEHTLARANLQACLGRCATGAAAPGLYQHATELMDQLLLTTQ